MTQIVQNMPPHINQGDKIILFDGVCKLCNAWCNFIVQHDKNQKFKLASVQSEEGQAILQHFKYPTDFYETMLLVHGNNCIGKSDAFFYIMKKLGFPWRFVLFFKIIPRTLRDWLYDRIALNRYTLFGKYDYCTLPSADHDKRYLKGE